jgi:NADH-quinone oxidoreductase subunit J
MNALFFLASAVAVLATLAVIVELNAIHALLYLIVSLLAVALIFVTLGAPFAAALEVIIYAGAIMVLFVFVVMMLNIGPRATEQERTWLRPRTWLGPGVLTALLLAGLIYTFSGSAGQLATVIEPKQVGISLFGPYVVGVELASMLLLAGLVAAFRLGR